MRYLLSVIDNAASPGTATPDEDAAIVQSQGTRAIVKHWRLSVRRMCVDNEK